MKFIREAVRRVRSAVAEKPYVRSHYGPLMLRRRGDRTFSYCVTGSYGDFTSSIIGDMREPFVLLDIGANQGIYSLLGDRNPHCAAVFAFEPVPANFHYLVGNIELNGARKVVPLCGAVTDDTSRLLVAMSFEAKHSGVSHILPSAGADAIYSPSLHAAHLGELLEPWRTEAIMAKIDVEGAELRVLGVLAQTPFFARLTHIIIEISSEYHSDAARAELLAFLEHAGFSEASRRQQAGWTMYDALYTRPAAAVADRSRAA